MPPDPGQEDLNRSPRAAPGTPTTPGLSLRGNHQRCSFPPGPRFPGEGGGPLPFAPGSRPRLPPRSESRGFPHPSCLPGTRKQGHARAPGRGVLPGSPWSSAGIAPVWGNVRIPGVASGKKRVESRRATSSWGFPGPIELSFSHPPLCRRKGAGSDHLQGHHPGLHRKTTPALAPHRRKSARANHQPNLSHTPHPAAIPAGEPGGPGSPQRGPGAGRDPG